MLPPKTPLADSTYRILHRLWRRGPCPVPVLVKDLGLSRAVADRILGQLDQEGIAAPDPATGLLKLQETYGAVLGLHMGTATISAAVVGFSGELLLTKDFPYPEEGTPLEAAILGAVARTEPFLRTAAIPPLRGLAVSLPAVVDPYRMVLVESKPLKIPGPLALHEVLTRPLGRPVTIENDANCCAWGEAVLHRREDLGNFLFLLVELRPQTVGHPKAGGFHFAAGMGLYLKGAVYHGSRYSAGEFQSVFHETGSTNQFSLSDGEMVRAPDDPVLEERVLREFSRHAAFLVNVLNLDRVFLSWPRPEGADRAVEILRQEIRLNWAYDGPVDCIVDLPSMGALAPAFGAAGLHLEGLYQPADGPAPFFQGRH